MDEKVRWMIRRDMPEVLEIEERCFGFDAWTEEDFIRFLRQRNCIGLACEVDDTVIGYSIYELRPKSIMLLNFAIHPDHQRRGVGTTMMKKLQQKLSYDRRRRLWCEVSEHNTEAHLFLKSCGLVATKVLRDFYAGNQDAYHFEYECRQLEPAGEVTQ
jgi:ribosomal-protein-alanine N-acetyltransferase